MKERRERERERERGGVRGKERERGGCWVESPCCCVGSAVSVFLLDPCVLYQCRSLKWDINWY